MIHWRGNGAALNAKAFILRRAISTYAFGAAVLGTAMVNPLLAIAKAAGGAAAGVTLGTVLSRPAAAKAAVQLARATERVATEGTPATLAGFQALQQRLWMLVAKEFGPATSDNFSPNAHSAPNYGML